MRWELKSSEDGEQERAMDFSRFQQNHGLVNDTAFYAVSGALFGGCVGAVKAAWAGAPRAAIPLGQAITGAGRAVGGSAITFAAIAGTYKAVSSITEGVRGRSDVWNGVAGGLAAGAVIAVKTQRGVVGAGAGLCYAALSAITEYNDNTLLPSNDIMHKKHVAVERAN